MLVVCKGWHELVQDCKVPNLNVQLTGILGALLRG